MSSHTVRISCRAAYADGNCLFDNQQLIGDTSIGDFQAANGANISSTYREVTLKLAVPRLQAEDFLEGLRTGTVELYIEGMKSVLELE